VITEIRHLLHAKKNDKKLSSIAD